MTYVSRMKPGSVLVDVAIDQGAAEDSWPTTHADPTSWCTTCCSTAWQTCLAPCPHTSTWALTNVTLPFVVELANKGWRRACQDDPALALRVNTHAGEITYEAAAQAFHLPHQPLAQVLA